VPTYVAMLGLGVAAVSGRSEPLLTVKAKKSLPLLDGNNTVLSGKIEADSEYDGSIVSDHTGSVPFLLRMNQPRCH
jgi:hypothetical protein